MTEYVILEESGGSVWTLMTSVTAHSAQAAIREFVRGSETPHLLRFVAVPARSWQPVSVSVVHVRQLKLEASA